MISNPIHPPHQAYVWIWLPRATNPVVAGLLSLRGEQLIFNYGRSYLERSDSIELYDPELPLQAGNISLLPGMNMPSCIRDASPDAWGRRVLISRQLSSVDGSQPLELSELTYLLQSGSDRIGALDFQESPVTYLPRTQKQTSLGELLAAAEKVEQGLPLSSDLDLALLHGSSLGGARPKVLLDDHEKKWIAKFSASNDLFSLVKAEYLAMSLAKKVGIHVAHVELCKALGKDVLLIERFDRLPEEAGWSRRAMVSALTILGLDEMMAAYASYENLAEIIRHRFKEPKSSLRELFSRIVFNILSGNTDDHARNHAAFWDGSTLELTPAYDLCPQSRTGQEASQAMLIYGSRRLSTLQTCIDAAHIFLLSQEEAVHIIQKQVQIIIHEWEQACDQAQLNPVDRALLWRRQFLNPYAFQDAPAPIAKLIA